MNIFIDFDKTICPDYSGKTMPMENAIATINDLYDAGHAINIYSYRTNPDCEQVFGRTVPQEIELMTNYLNKWHIKFHGFILNKPLFDILIDDRSHNPQEVGWKAIAEKLL